MQIEEGGRSWRAAMEERVSSGQLFKDLYELREDLGKCVIITLDLKLEIVAFPSVLCKI